MSVLTIHFEPEHKGTGSPEDEKKVNHFDELLE